MHEQMAIDRISEIGNLTDNLDDDTASWLIRWGIEKSTALIADIADVEEAGAKLNNVMAFMRKINEIIPARTVKKSGDLKSDLKVLVELYAKAFELTPQVSAKELTKHAGKIKKQSPLAAIQSLVTITAPQAESKTTTRKAKE
jgi:hypothetical protein